MAHKQDGSIYQVACHKLKSSFLQVLELLSRWIEELKYGYSIFENFRQHAQPVPIEIHIQPVAIEKVEVKTR